MMKYFLLSMLVLGSSSLIGQVTFEAVCINKTETHDAFTTLASLGDKLFLAYREGEHHVYGENGQIVILSSADQGAHWTGHDTISSIQYDLRDPKLSVTPDERLMLLVGGSVYRDKTLVSMQTQVVFSNSQGIFTDTLVPVEIDARIRANRDWLWRTTWYGDTCYGVVYQGSTQTSSLVKSGDGIHYDLVRLLELDGRPTEATVRFLEDGTMVIVHRRDAKDKNGFLGISESPYQSWKWIPLSYQLGGPDLFFHKSDQYLLATRKYQEDGNEVVLLSGDLEGNLEELGVFPSGGDCSYPSFLQVGSRILISYYSSHEGKANIYLASIESSGLH